MSEPTVSWGERWRPRLRRMHARARGALPFASGVFGTLVALLLYRLLFPGPPQLTAREVSESVAAALASATPRPAFSSVAYQLIEPSLVLIETDASGDGEAGDGDYGSGVIVNTDGDILTSLRVVTQAKSIRLTFADGTQSAAQLMAVQPQNDIAVLRAMQPPAKLVPATLGNPGALHIGDEAFVVGHPFGLRSSMSAGVISGFDREFKPDGGKIELQGLIQFDAAVNPGNGGGPLLNRNGEVIGIVTGLMNPTDSEFFVGVGFAVPITTAGQAVGAPPY